MISSIRKTQIPACPILGGIFLDSFHLLTGRYNFPALWCLFIFQFAYQPFID